MKKEKNNKKLIIIVLAVIIIIVLITLGVLKYFNLFVFKPVYSDVSGLKLLGSTYKYSDLENNYLFTNYDSYYSTVSNIEGLNVNIVNKDDFNNNNFVLVKIIYDECSEKNLTPQKYDINGNNIVITFTYEDVCGLCALDYMYYLLKVDKTVNNPKVDIEYNLVGPRKNCGNVEYKPMIYLYPEKDMNVSIKLSNSNYLLSTYPKYNNGWNVFVKKDGTIKYNNREYYGLYWEADNHYSNIKEDGFVVKGSEVASFLEEKLKILGLTDRESNEFIVFWLDKLENNKYNYIRFETIDEINNYMKLDINPLPNTIIRIYMDYKPLDERINIKEQYLETPVRNGFTVVEWGGSLIN